jgi:hypothetical protein
VTSALVDRIVYGPSPPVGRPYKLRWRLRCALGLHRRAETWEFTTLGQMDEELPDGSWRHEKRVGINLDREPDYVGCQWCRRIW